MIIKLREAILAYERRTGTRLTYDDLASMTGLAVGTLQSIATREGYHTSLANVEKLCAALGVRIQDFLDVVPDVPKAPAKPKRAAGRKRG